jgi:hypothetical protein
MTPADISVLFVAAILSAALVIRYGEIGVVLGVLSAWLLVLGWIDLAAPALGSFSVGRRGAWVNDGWAICLIWTLPFWIGRMTYRWFRARRTSAA